MQFAVKRIVLNHGETKNDEGRTLPIYGEMLEWLRVENESRNVNFPVCQFLFSKGGDQLSNWRNDWAPLVLPQECVDCFSMNFDERPSAT